MRGIVTRVYFEVHVEGGGISTERAPSPCFRPAGPRRARVWLLDLSFKSRYLNRQDQVKIEAIYVAARNGVVDCRSSIDLGISTSAREGGPDGSPYKDRCAARSGSRPKGLQRIAIDPDRFL
jgi:hypothetical protein